ncbi:MAG: polysaccharide deacetylase family protein [Rubrobacter sp.]|nr:polysaccharide deacetylase family protein [Rubrobacter sp.]
MHNGERRTAPVALTFDDGPDPVWTPLVLDALAMASASATFFVVAPLAQRYPYLLARMREEGHAVAFHCTRHVRHDDSTQAEIEADVEHGLLALGRSVKYWRTPWGVVTPATRRVAREHALSLVGWTADTQDWRGGPHEEMLARIEGEVLHESIVLMHDGVGPGATRDGCAETVALVEPLVSLARSRGLEPAPLDELHHPPPDRNPDFPAVDNDLARFRRV